MLIPISFYLGNHHQPQNLIAHTSPILVRTANEGQAEGHPFEENSHSSSQRAASGPPFISSPSTTTTETTQQIKTRKGPVVGIWESKVDRVCFDGTEDA